MSVFEFYTVLLSFMVSLGVASLLGAIARLIQESERVKFSWSYALWCLVIFNLMVVFWIKAWSYHEVFTLRISQAGPPLVLAIVGFLACGLATPPIPDEGPIDLDAFHTRHGPRYMIMLGAFMLVSVPQGLAMGDFALDQLLVSPDPVFSSLLGAAACFAAALIRNRWVQLVAPLLFLAGSVAYYVRLIGW